MVKEKLQIWCTIRNLRYPRTDPPNETWIQIAVNYLQITVTVLGFILEILPFKIPLKLSLKHRSDRYTFRSIRTKETELNDKEKINNVSTFKRLTFSNSYYFPATFRRVIKVIDFRVRVVSVYREKWGFKNALCIWG